MTTSSCGVRGVRLTEHDAAGGRTMSLDVPTELLERAEHDDVGDAEFVACVRDSLPYAWQVISRGRVRPARRPRAVRGPRDTAAERDRTRPTAARTGLRRDPRRAG